MASLFERIDTVFLKVKDFEKAIEWYCSVLGFSVRWVDESGGYAALNIGETPLTLVRDSGDVMSERSNVSFNFYCSDIENAHQHLEENNVATEAIQEDGNAKWFAFEDMEGNKLEVCSF